MNKMKQVLYGALALAMVAAPLAAGAATDGSSIDNQESFGYDTTTTADEAEGISDLPIFVLISTFMNWLLGIVGVLAVVAFVISGILYLTAAGDEDRIEMAKGVMMYAIIGLVVALLGLVIVNALTGLLGAQGGQSY